MPLIDFPAKPKTKVDVAIKYDVQQIIDEERQVTVHCKYDAGNEGDGIRIWKSTFLYARDSSHKSSLIHTLKISIYPSWTFIEPGKSFYFTLIFSGLPSSCKSFDLIENIPEPGGFFVENISRNDLDVYNVDIS